MGLLDDLRQQSATLQEKELKEQEKRAHAENVYKTQTIPALNKIYETLKELAKHLNYINLDISATYQFNVDGLMITLKQVEHQATIDSSKETKLVNFTCRCEHAKDIVFKAAGKTKVEENLQFLKNSSIVFQFKPDKNDAHEITGAHFLVKPSIPVSMNFKPDIDNCCIKITMQNFGDLSVRSYVMQPERVNDEFVDRLGRFIVREIDDLFNEKVDDQTRELLRAKIEEEQNQRQAELQEAERVRAEEEEKKRLEAANSRFGFLKKIKLPKAAS